MINLVGAAVGLAASKNTLKLCIANPFETGGNIDAILTSSLAELMESGKLMFRDYAHEYRLWEGSDFDVATALRKQKSLLVNESLVKILESAAPLAPIIAARHSYLTGTLTKFSRHWIDLDSIHDLGSLDLDENADGLLFYCFGEERLPGELPDATRDGRPIVIAYSSSIRQVSHMALEAKAASDLLKVSSDLARDGIARKEVKFRAQTSKRLLEERLKEIFSINNGETLWFAQHAKFRPDSHRDISSILSDTCDRYYNKRPIIRNELVNRNKLTSAAARARRELLEAMTTSHHLPAFGLTGTGPEVAIYRTVILAEKMHIKTNDFSWKIVPPEPSSSLYHAWNEIKSILERNSETSINLKDLFLTLKKPPFGIKNGPIPIIVGLFLVVESAEVGLFQEGAYCPAIGPEEMELMAKRPSLFSVKQFKLTENKRLLLDLYRTVLGVTPIGSGDKFRNSSIINIVGPLVTFFANLPQYVQQTKTISTDAQKLRQVVLQAKEPADLLFQQIPHALGIEGLDETQDKKLVKQFEGRLDQALSEIKKAFPALLKRVCSSYSRVFHHDGDTSTLRKKLVARFGPLAHKSSEVVRRFETLERDL
ncbi:MAG: hypothetical protein ACP5U1_17330 [Desulfomonilaceae bacterium]